MFWYEKILINKQADENMSFKFEDTADLKWIASQTSHNSYQLIEDNRTIGSLVFHKKSKRIAAGKIDGREFKIKKHWLFSNSIFIEPNDLRMHTMLITDFNKGGMIELDGEKIFWKCYSRLQNEWMFANENNKKIIAFKPVTSFYKTGYFAQIKSKGFDKHSITILLLLGIFNLIIMDEMTGITSAFI